MPNPSAAHNSLRAGTLVLLSFLSLASCKQEPPPRPSPFPELLSRIEQAAKTSRNIEFTTPTSITIPEGPDVWLFATPYCLQEHMDSLGLNLRSWDQSTLFDYNNMREQTLMARISPRGLHEVAWLDNGQRVKPTVFVARSGDVLSITPGNVERSPRIALNSQTIPPPQPSPFPELINKVEAAGDALQQLKRPDASISLTIPPGPDRWLIAAPYCLEESWDRLGLKLESLQKHNLLHANTYWEQTLLARISPDGLKEFTWLTCAQVPKPAAFLAQSGDTLTLRTLGIDGAQSIELNPRPTPLAPPQK